MPGDGIQIRTKVSSNINGTTVKQWLNGTTPPGVVTLRMNLMADAALAYAIATAPTNNPLNAVHRGGVVGTYRAGIRMERTGNQYGRGFKLIGTARHSDVVENGRSASNREQFFSWTRARPPGSMRWYTHTGARRGRRVLINAAERGVRSVTGFQ
jgi:hypothetical protein